MKEYKKPILNIAVFDSGDQIQTMTSGIKVEAEDSTSAIKAAVGINGDFDKTDFKLMFTW